MLSLSCVRFLCGMRPAGYNKHAPPGLTSTRCRRARPGNLSQLRPARAPALRAVLISSPTADFTLAKHLIGKPCRALLPAIASGANGPVAYHRQAADLVALQRRHPNTVRHPPDICGGFQCQPPAVSPVPSILATEPTDADLPAFGWAPGGYCGSCRRCGGRLTATRDAPLPLRSCAVSAVHERTRYRASGEAAVAAIIAHEALTKAILIDVPLQRPRGRPGGSRGDNRGWLSPSWSDRDAIRRTYNSNASVAPTAPILAEKSTRVHGKSLGVVFTPSTSSVTDASHRRRKLCRPAARPYAPAA
jgi:hypothetical protein